MGQVASFLSRPGARYLLVGFTVYIFEICIIIAMEAWGASAAWAVATSFCLGTLVSFFLQKFVTFGDKRMQRKILLPQIIATALLILWNLAFSVLLTSLLNEALPATLTRTIALGITTVWNFYLYKTRIFKNPTAPLVD